MTWLPLKGEVYSVTIRIVLRYGCHMYPIGVQGVWGFSMFDHRYLRSVAQICGVNIGWVMTRWDVVCWVQAVVLWSRWPLYTAVDHLDMCDMSAYHISFSALLHVLVKAEGGRWGDQAAIWRRDMKLLTSVLALVGVSRTRGWCPADEKCWLETLRGMTHNGSHCRGCCAHYP